MPSRLLRQAAALAVFALLGIVADSRAGVQPSSTGSDDAALAWLRSAAAAPRLVSYAGTKAITLWGGQVQASQVRVYHKAPDQTRLEYIPAGLQPRRIVIIADGRVEEYVPARNQVIERAVPQAGEAHLTRSLLPQILSNYQVTFGPDDRVAGRPARVIEVRGKFPG